ncbi:MAG: exosortase [Chthoniobacteraceae bacterium]|nr:exosortase [Chthoniobacteraceae bacterium]
MIERDDLSLPSNVPYDYGLDLKPANQKEQLPGYLFLILILFGWLSWICLDFWLYSPQYSYGAVVPFLSAYFLVRRLGTVDLSGAMAPGIPILPAIGFAAAILSLDMARWFWGSLTLIYAGATLVLAMTLLFASRMFGTRGLQVVIAPACFFLTSLPWPSQIVNLLSGHLQEWVTSCTLESLQWFGYLAERRSFVIILPQGPVAIADACSGLRSLQASVMLSIGLGELFMLTWKRRGFLFICGMAMALLLNFLRVLILCIAVSRMIPAESFARLHDWLGEAVMWCNLALLGSMAWMFAAPKSETHAPVRNHPFAWGSLAGTPAARLGMTILVVTLVTEMTFSVWERHLARQTSASFLATNEAVAPKLKVPDPVLAMLAPTSGYYRKLPLPGAEGATQADAYHFFWKPSARNYLATQHRPDICMTGAGWKTSAEVRTMEIEFEGSRLPFSVYTFHNTECDQYAVQLWGIWRDGESIASKGMDSALNVRQSAVEVVSCTVSALGRQPLPSEAIAALHIFFKYSVPMKL